MEFTCDLCGDVIEFDMETKCEKCELIRCEVCTDTCVECGELICCNEGIFKTDVCIECEKKLYIDLD